MEYGILIAVADDGLFQVVSTVSSLDEAREIANNYLRVGPDCGYVAPEEFEIHRRGTHGGYTEIEHLRLT